MVALLGCVVTFPAYREFMTTDTPIDSTACSHSQALTPQHHSLHDVAAFQATSSNTKRDFTMQGFNMG